MAHGDRTGVFDKLGISDSREIGVKYQVQLMRAARANRLGKVLGYALRRDGTPTIEVFGENATISIDPMTWHVVRAGTIHKIGKRAYRSNPRKRRTYRRRSARRKSRSRR